MAKQICLVIGMAALMAAFASCRRDRDGLLDELDDLDDWGSCSGEGAYCSYSGDCCSDCCEDSNCVSSSYCDSSDDDYEDDNYEDEGPESVAIVGTNASLVGGTHSTEPVPEPTYTGHESQISSARWVDVSEEGGTLELELMSYVPAQAVHFLIEGEHYVYNLDGAALDEAPEINVCEISASIGVPCTEACEEACSCITGCSNEILSVQEQCVLTCSASASVGAIGPGAQFVNEADWVAQVGAPAVEMVNGGCNLSQCEAAAPAPEPEPETVYVDFANQGSWEMPETQAQIATPAPAEDRGMLSNGYAVSPPIKVGRNCDPMACQD